MIYSFAYLMCTDYTESVLLFHLDMHPRDGTRLFSLAAGTFPSRAILLASHQVFEVGILQQVKAQTAT